jgi:hypothetical protein
MGINLLNFSVLIRISPYSSPLCGKNENCMSDKIFLDTNIMDSRPNRITARIRSNRF